MKTVPRQRNLVKAKFTSLTQTITDQTRHKRSAHGLKPNCLSFGEVLAQSFAVIAPTTIPASNIGLIVAVYQLTRIPVMVDALTRYGDQLIPFVLIGLGVLILVDCHTLENPDLAVLTFITGSFCLLTLNRNFWRTSEIASEVEKF